MILRFVGCMNRKNMENEFINERFLVTTQHPQGMR